jgi:hypothetical protein
VKSAITRLSARQRAEFLALFEENPTPLTAFPLSTVQGRRDFLYRFSEKDEEGIFEAVQAVWAQLNHPKSYQCAKMAKAAGLPGSGKKALRAVLMAFLHDFNSIDVTPLVDRADYATMDEWQAALSAHFAKGDAVMNATLDKWEPIMNGDNQLESHSFSQQANMIIGPWVPLNQQGSGIRQSNPE